MALRSYVIWRFGAVAALILGGTALSGAQPSPRRVLKHESERHELFPYPGGVFLPVWEGGALLYVEDNMSDVPVIFGIDRNGRMERIDFSFPGGRYIGLLGLAGTRDGTIAAIGSAYDDEGRPVTFLARITPDRSRKIVTQLWPYAALAVTVLPNGEIWTVGYVKRRDNLGISEYNVLKRFDSSGKLLATTAVKARGLLARAPWPDAAQHSLMKSSKDRVGWLTNANEYIEFSFDGRELGRFEPPPGPTPEAFESTIALSDDDEVLVGTRDGDCLRVWSLDRQERAWKPVDLSRRKLTRSAILGFDGDKVVVIDDRHISGATVARYSFLKVK